jgi:glucose-6-phosphate 1-dehydrogenase
MLILDPCVFTIFGSTGHLSRTKLLPSLYHLEAENRLPVGIVIVCVGRKPWNDETWRKEVTGWLKERIGDKLDTDCLNRFLEKVFYFLGDIGDEDTFR